MPETLDHTIQPWEIKYGQISIGVKDYDLAIKLFDEYLDRNFDIETSEGVFKSKHFLHYENTKTLRLACKPFFKKLNEGDNISIWPVRKGLIKISKEEPAEPPSPTSVRKTVETTGEPELSPEMRSIVEHLRQTQLKSESHTEFEEAIKEAFNYLGFEAQLIGGKGDTDVLLTANIGSKSFKVNVDGKTTKSGRIIDRQIDWVSLDDHKKKNKADFVVVIGPSFSGGNLEDRAKHYDVSLLKTEDLIKLVKRHSKFPFTLAELKDLFVGKGSKSLQLEDLLTQNFSRRSLLKKFRVIIEEMQSLQDRLGYFTKNSLAGREKIEELEIEPEVIDYIIRLLKLPFVNGVKEISENKYILTIRIKDIANIFQQISDLLVRPREKEEIPPTPDQGIEEEPIQEKKYGSKYFKWDIRRHSIVAAARKERPYEHYCPIIHFETILKKIIEGFKNQNIINTDIISSMLKGEDLSPDRPFKGKPEEYKIRMALGILEIEELIKWTGSKRPIEYKLNVTIEKIKGWAYRELKIEI